MKVPFIKELFRYNDSANGRILQLCRQVADGKLDQPFEMGHGSLRKTLVHILAIERLWLTRWTSASVPLHRSEAPNIAFDDLTEGFGSVAQERKTLFGAMPSTMLDRPVHYHSRKGDRFEHRLGELALHVCNHGTYHRAQAATMLQHLGVTLPESSSGYLGIWLETDGDARLSVLDRVGLKTFFHYADWARHRIQAAAAPLTDVQLDHHFNFGDGTIRRALYRAWLSEQWWLDNWLFGPGHSVEADPNTPSVAEIVQRFDETVCARNAFLDRIVDQDLLQPVSGQTRPGALITHPLGVTMLDLCIQGTQWRSLCANMLRHVGATVPETDVTMLLREAESVSIETLALA